MNSTLLSVALISSLALGCGGSAAMHAAKAPAKAPAAAADAKGETASARAEDYNDPPFGAPAAPEAPTKIGPPAEAEKVAARMPGDFVVHRFSGSFRDTPITLTQRVLSREGNTLVVDITFEEGGSKQALRVRMDDSVEKRGDVLSVARLEGEREKPGSMEMYEDLMARTALAADQNEEVLGSEALTIDVGGAAMACQKTSYRVRIGKRQGTLRTVQSDGFAWGDLSGEITSESGDVVYKAELVEAGHGDAPKPAVAHSAYDDE